MRKEEAGKMMFNAAIQLTAGVLANPASANRLTDTELLTDAVHVSVEVAKKVFSQFGFDVDD